ncbi:MAG: protein translocase subunit SecF [Firmicutes bacterium]|nr:protein translocase subunit SecF [Bacillota bacterium]
MIKFYNNRWRYFIISIVALAVGVIAFFINGVSLDIQFKGGAIIKYSYTGDVDFSEVSAIVTEKLNRGVEIQETTSNVDNVETKSIVLNLADNEGLSEDEQIALDEALKERFPNSDLTLTGSSVVKPFIGRRFFITSIRAVLLASLLIMIFIWYRFRKISGASAGVMALVALLHDVAIVFFVFIVFKMPINDSFIAAALTIVGYSINDTIVIYDRIRENRRLLGVKVPVDELVDKSINQSLVRSINTSITTFVSITIVYIFALIYNIDSIKSFALPMMFGIVSGCYSSVCLAGPLWVSWQKFKSKAKTA